MRLLACLVLVGCATTAPSDDPFDIEPGTGGGADGAGFPVLDVEPGDRVSLAVAALPAGASLDEVDLPDHMVALRMHGRGAIVVHRESGYLDPFIIVKDTTKATLAQSFDQVVAPALDPRDAIVVVNDDGAIVLISGEDLKSGGDFTVDVVALPAPRSMLLEGTVARVTGASLRTLEPTRADFVAKGYLVERADGGIDEQLAKIPISERARVAGVANDIRSARSALAEFLAPDAPADAAANLAAIWAL